MFRVGIGFDLHRMGPDLPLIIGTVEVPHHRGAIAHSDGDVLCHAVTDALLGAAGAGNIGELFPDTDPRYKGASSVTFLVRAAELVRQNGFEIGNIDANVLAERPKLMSFLPEMKKRIAGVLGVAERQVHVKAKTMERLGMIGAEEAIAAEAVALIFSQNG